MGTEQGWKGDDRGRALRIGPTAATLFRGLVAVSPTDADAFLTRIRALDPGGLRDRWAGFAVAASVIRSLLIPLNHHADWVSRSMLNNVAEALESADSAAIAAATKRSAELAHSLQRFCTPGSPSVLACRSLATAGVAGTPDLSDFIRGVASCVVVAARLQRQVDSVEAGRLQHTAHLRIAKLFIRALAHPTSEQARMPLRPPPGIEDDTLRTSALA